ncbi:MAG: transcriptional regulator [Ignavibacteria bacterium]|nr:transcriptional regulator [Ignavibacteria bacterium]
MTKNFDHHKIDEIIHSRIRLSIMAALATVDVMDFLTLLDEVNTTKGNLSVHLSKLEENGYIVTEKKFVKKKTLTLCKITPEGITAFHEYLNMVEEFARKAATGKDSNQ